VPDATRNQLLEFAGQAATGSSCLQVLIIELTFTSAEEGLKFLQALADSTIESLRQVTITDEPMWFGYGGEECMAPLIAFLARQTALESLTMQRCQLKEAHESSIRQTISETAPNCQVTINDKFNNDFNFKW